MIEINFRNGDVLPAIGLGTWMSKGDEAYDAVLEAIRIGYRHIDCAYFYGNEKEVGKALHYVLSEGVVKRSELFITSKLWNSYHHPQMVEVGLRKSLTDLQLDYLDLYLMHWPVVFKDGHDRALSNDDLLPLDAVPLAATWAAMEDLTFNGSVRHIGVSNFNVPKLAHLMTNARIRPELNQIELHPYFQQRELVDYCIQHDVLVTAYSPLGSWHLVHSDGGLTRETCVIQLAQKHGCTPAQVLLAWGLGRGTAVIPKSVNAARISENLGACKVQLDAVDTKMLDQLECGMRMAKGAYCMFEGGFYTPQNVWEE